MLGSSLFFFHMTRRTSYLDGKTWVQQRKQRLRLERSSETTCSSPSKRAASSRGMSPQLNSSSGSPQTNHVDVIFEPAKSHPTAAPRKIHSVSRTREVASRRSSDAGLILELIQLPPAASPFSSASFSSSSAKTFVQVDNKCPGESAELRHGWG